MLMLRALPCSLLQFVPQPVRLSGGGLNVGGLGLPQGCAPPPRPKTLRGSRPRVPGLATWPHTLEGGSPRAEGSGGCPTRSLHPCPLTPRCCRRPWEIAPRVTGEAAGSPYCGHRRGLGTRTRSQAGHHNPVDAGGQTPPKHTAEAGCPPRGSRGHCQALLSPLVLEPASLPQLKAAVCIFIFNFTIQLFKMKSQVARLYPKINPPQTMVPRLGKLTQFI